MNIYLIVSYQMLFDMKLCIKRKASFLHLMYLFISIYLVFVADSAYIAYFTLHLFNFKIYYNILKYIEYD